MNAKGVAQLAGIQSRVQWSRCRQRIGGGWDRLDAVQIYLEIHTLARRIGKHFDRVAVPRGLASRGKVIDPARKGTALAEQPKSRNDLRRYICNQGCRGRCAKLIGDNAQAVALAPELQHGLGEIAPMRTRDPASTQHKRCRARG